MSMLIGDLRCPQCGERVYDSGHRCPRKLQLLTPAQAAVLEAATNQMHSGNAYSNCECEHMYCTHHKHWFRDIALTERAAEALRTEAE